MKLTQLELNADFPDQTGINILIADMTALAAMVEADIENQVLRRAYVRAGLAMVEGLTDYMKQFAHDFASGIILPLQRHLGPIIHHCPIEFLTQTITHTELALLRDEQARVKSNGTIVTSTGYLDFKTNIKFLISEYCKIFTISHSFDLSTDVGWTSLMNSVDIRNRIMHPKTTENVEITDKEILIVRDGMQWLLNFYGSLISSMSEKLPIIQQDMLDWVAEIQPNLLDEAREFVAAGNQQIQG